MRELLHQVITTESGLYITLVIGLLTGIAITLLYGLCYTQRLRHENFQMKALLGRDINKPLER